MVVLAVEVEEVVEEVEISAAALVSPLSAARRCKIMSSLITELEFVNKIGEGKKRAGALRGYINVGRSGAKVALQFHPQNTPGTRHVCLSFVLFINMYEFHI